jgi:hypothetical protein
MMGSSVVDDFVKSQNGPNLEALVNGRQVYKEQGREILTYDKQIETRVRRPKNAPGKRNPDFLWAKL